MSVVKINVLTVPADQRDVLEERFAARAGLVEGAEGFEWFELLRPSDGTDEYFVYTRWRSEEDYQKWFNGTMRQGHQGGDGEQRKPAATGAQLKAFEVVQTAAPKNA
ncbi:antibiotic biosynthesis monooxygenase [Streptomyces sp. AV19]|uniref:antibiotic biosynthesis monooxygenase family protein n=1 Tax=Streptomyces sp. AV19 TaxID=2793068 RepID=UPI0018FE3E7F|nr:antibiotic biosynthesis monooxygenase [Streptomyces sp. AV19]MBH1934428.1 antibiotic biosynthesis monooxygenase [Streptomyces sp. AV19]MDG4533217.1 antibiotic biosynthesis monooxygenase [Streptomyces sp. AV19]